MFSLQDLLGQEQGAQAVALISQSVGADNSLVSSAIQMALPAIMGGLANNASTPEGAENLNNTLEQHHDGSILDNIGGLAGMIFGGGQQGAASPAVDAGSILTHILGNSQGQIAEQVSGYPPLAGYAFLLAPSTTPESLLVRLHAEMNKVVRSEAYLQRLEGDGGTAQVFATLAEAKSFFDRDGQRWAALTRKSGIKVE